MRHQTPDKVRPTTGITLVEVLVVLGIITLLLGLITPAVQHVRAAADKIACQSNMRQLGVAVQLYHQDYHRIPRPAFNMYNWQRDPNVLLSILTHLSPYFEASHVFQGGVEDCGTGSRPWLNPPHQGVNTVIRVLCCPADSRLNQPMVDIAGLSAAYTSYVPCRGGTKLSNGFFGKDGATHGLRLTDIRDGLSNTIMMGERPPPDTLQAGRWYPVQTPYSSLWGDYLPGPDNAMTTFNPISAGDPCDGIYSLYRYGVTSNPCHRYHYWSLHPNGANFVMGDSSMKFLKYSVGQSVLDALASRVGGESLVDLDE